MANITEKSAKQQNRPPDCSVKSVNFRNLGHWSGLLTQGIQVVYGVQGNPKGTHTHGC